MSPETFHEPDRSGSSSVPTRRRHLRALVARLAEDGADPGPEAFAECGSLVVALAEHEDPWFTEVRRRGRRPQPRRHRDPRRRGARHVPAAGPAVAGPAQPDGGPRRRSAPVRRACVAPRQRRGVTLVAMEAIGVDRRGDRVTAVRGADGVVPCGALVLAGGAWSAGAARGSASSCR